MQYGQIDGCENIWICKPSFTARGVGIYCFSSLRELFKGSNKVTMCPKIVQKYVERSFLIDKNYMTIQESKPKEQLEELRKT